MRLLKIFGTILFAHLVILNSQGQEHPSLMISKSSVLEIRKHMDKAPLFIQSLEAVRSEVDAEIETGIHVPIPKDMAGGYTHERHKRNFFMLQKAGYLFQITGQTKYAKYIRDHFKAYAEMFPTLPKHPTDRSYATGKIFWQCLNDANWLVYCSQAYDCIYDWLSAEERNHLESNLFRPLADFLSVENPQFFNRVHNHSTWGIAAVGMIGLVMDDKELIDRALNGLQDSISADLVDNDGGYIKKDAVRKVGFFAQLDYSFSPDGHFTEGPYYLRYAMTPFLLFAKSLKNCRPDLEIFAYRDGILRKAIYSLLYETDAQGQFFPINDAQKGMSWLAREVVSAVNIGYHDLGRDPMLLSIAKLQKRVQLDETGFTVARDIALDKSQPFKHKSISYVDGPEGQSGGLTIMRSDNQEGEELCVLMKYAAQGMGHGHFDRLGFSLYDEHHEVIQDYGSARWVNIDQKGGGRYLPENQSFAKQTIAHNTLVVDQKSQYKGDVRTGEQHNPERFFQDLENPNIQVVSAKDHYAYPGVEMHRTLILFKDGQLKNPVLIDIMKAESDEPRSFDLPIWFSGHLLSTNFEYATQTQQLTSLGYDAGYQHLWEEANGKSSGQSTQVTWFGNGKFFTLTASSKPNEQLIFARAGANDPNFNLRHDPVFIRRRTDEKQTVFASVIESHGTYSPVTEIPLSPFTSIDHVEIIHDDSAYTMISLSKKNQTTWLVMLSNKNQNETQEHKVKVGNQVYEWQGPFNFLILKK